MNFKFLVILSFLAFTLGCSEDEEMGSCSDGIMNRSEEGVDCGGLCTPCEERCNDGVMNGDETGIDCGGISCSPCEENFRYYISGILNGEYFIYGVQTWLSANSQGILSKTSDSCSYDFQAGFDELIGFSSIADAYSCEEDLDLSSVAERIKENNNFVFVSEDGPDAERYAIMDYIDDEENVYTSLFSSEGSSNQLVIDSVSEAIIPFDQEENTFYEITGNYSSSLTQFEIDTAFNVILGETITIEDGKFKLIIKE